MASSDPIPGAALDEPREEMRNARERILEAASRLFQQYGYEGASINKIARAADMVPASIYWHFPSKHDLLEEVLRTLYRVSYDELAGAVGDGSASERLRDYVKAYVHIQLSVLDENCNFSYTSLASALTPEAGRDLLREGRPYLDLMREIMRQGAESGEFDFADLTVTSYAISSLCEYVFTWYRKGQRLSEEEVQEHYAVLALRLVGAR